VQAGRGRGEDRIGSKVHVRAANPSSPAAGRCVEAGARASAPDRCSDRTPTPTLPLSGGGTQGRERVANPRHNHLGLVAQVNASVIPAVCAALLLALVALAGGCATVLPPAPSPAIVAADDSLAARCARAFAALDEAVARAGVADAETARVGGFPYLRVNRLLASFRDEVGSDAAIREWIGYMQRLGREGWLVEIANLPPKDTEALLATLGEQGFGELPPTAFIEGCGNALRDGPDATPARREALRAAAVVPDDYDEWKRVVGAYPATRIPFAAGVRRWQDGTRAVFAQPLTALPVKGELKRYTVAGDTVGRERTRDVIAAARAASALGLPDASALAPLFATYAPVFEIDAASDADRVGRPAHGANGPAVDVSRPAIFTRVAYTRYDGRVHPQLVYAVWFPERPPSGPFDPLAGKLDAVIWRVTLDDSGEPLAFDTIHGCGCYHLWFPTPRARPLPLRDSLDEQAFVPASLPRVRAGERVVMRIAAGTHYVENVRVVPDERSDALRLPPADDDALRRLPLAAGGTRSLFGPDGIVPGTERGERWFFWPMGVREPGAMRQWGRHATAFVGRQHFDDADLFARYFVIESPSP